MKFTPHIANPVDQCLFDMHVDIFQLNPHRQPIGVQLGLDLLQSVSNLVLLVWNRSGRRSTEHLRMGDGSTNILSIKTSIEANAFGILLQSLVCTGLKDAAAGWTFHGLTIRIGLSAE